MGRVTRIGEENSHLFCKKLGWGGGFVQEEVGKCLI